VSRKGTEGGRAIVDRERRRRIVGSHRLLGLVATVPIVGWIASSFVLHGVGLALPEHGLQGDYTLRVPEAGDALLAEEATVSPTELLEKLESEGVSRIYWLRLTRVGGRAVYIVKPAPHDLERTYDAATGTRLDPLPPELLRRRADEELTGTQAVSFDEAPAFNRYYAVDRVPAVRFQMEGEQPTELVLSTASGRTLSRTDPLAACFQRAYRSVHVWQWGDDVRLFTALLYGLVGLSLTVVVLGSILWIDRRGRGGLPPVARRSRKIHGTLAPVAGALLATQMLVGAYLWYNLGPIEPRFRGQGSFRAEWVGGIETSEGLAPPPRLEAAFRRAGKEEGAPVHAFEWREVGGHRLWIVSSRRDDEGLLFEAGTGRPLDRLDRSTARRAAEAVVVGRATEFRGEADEYWMDLNRRVPTYLFRFDDPDRSDVHVSQTTGEVVQRRPAIWRGFAPFLVYHTFAFTGHAVLDTVLLTALQLAVLVMVVTGWILARPLLPRRT